MSRTAVNKNGLAQVCSFAVQVLPSFLTEMLLIINPHVLQRSEPHTQQRAQTDPYILLYQIQPEFIIKNIALIQLD